MPAPLLATKLFVPPPGKILVERLRLMKRLYECLHPACRLALISAPAGFGKTTLVSAWAASLKTSELEPCLSFVWGFASYLARYPDDQLTIIVLSNVDTTHAAQMGRELAAIVFGGQ